MDKNWKKRTVCLVSAAMLLAAGAGTGRAMAYFTTYAEASGSAVLNLGTTTTIPDEEVKDWVKHVTIENTGEYECYVRARAYAGAEYNLDYIIGAWRDGGDGWYYYDTPLQPGETTSELQIKIDKGNAAEEFNVIVVQEHTPVRYNEDGPYGQWTAAAGKESGSTEQPENGGGSQE